MNKNCHIATMTAEVVSSGGGEPGGAGLPPGGRRGRSWRWILVPCWLALGFLVIRHLGEMPLLPALAGVFLVSAPIAVTGVYLSSIAQCRRLTLFASEGVVYAVLSGRWVRIILWSVWAALTGLFMVLEFRTHTPAEWWGVIPVVPVFAMVFWGMRRLLAAELKPYLVTRGAILATQWLAPVIMLFVYLAVLRRLESPPEWDSVREAVEAAKAGAGPMTGSALLSEASQWMAFFSGVKAYVLGRAGALDDWVALAVLAAGKFVVFFNVCSILSCFVIPRREFRRAFARPTDADEPGPVSAGRVVSALLLALVPLAILLALARPLEEWLQETPALSAARSRLESRLAIAAEKIGDELFRKGTLAKLQELREGLLAGSKDSVAQFERAVDDAFAKIEGRVDSYLDGYYSLWGEYARIGMMVAGRFEGYMEEKLGEALGREEIYAKVGEAYAKALQVHRELEETFNRRAAAIKAENRIEPAGRGVTIVRSEPRAERLQFPKPPELVALEARLGLAAGAGIGAGALSGRLAATVTRRIVERTLQGPVFKKAVQAVVGVVIKKTGSRFVGAGGGAAAGALVGSVVPGVGNVAGAVVGGLVGLATSVAVDKVLLEIEEMVNREKFKAEILAAIQAAQAEFKRGVFGRLP